MKTGHPANDALPRPGPDRCFPAGCFGLFCQPACARDTSSEQAARGPSGRMDSEPRAKEAGRAKDRRQARRRSGGGGDAGAGTGTAAPSPARITPFSPGPPATTAMGPATAMGMAAREKATATATAAVMGPAAAAAAAAAFAAPGGGGGASVPCTPSARGAAAAEVDADGLDDALLVQIPHLHVSGSGDAGGDAADGMAAEALRNGVSMTDIATVTSHRPHTMSPALSPTAPHGSASGFGMWEYDSGHGSILSAVQPARMSLGAVWASAGPGGGGGGGGGGGAPVLPSSRHSFLQAVGSRVSSANSHTSTTRTSGSRPSRWGIRNLTGMLSAGLTSFRQHLARMAEPLTGNLRAEAVAELTQWTSRADLIRAIAQVTDVEIVSQSAARSVVCRGKAGGTQVFIKYTAAAGSGEGMAVPATEGLLSRLLVHPNVVRTYGLHLTQVAAEDVYGDLEAALAAAAAADRRRQQQRQQQQSCRRIMKRFRQPLEHELQFMQRQQTHQQQANQHLQQQIPQIQQQQMQQQQQQQSTQQKTQQHQQPDQQRQPQQAAVATPQANGGGLHPPSPVSEPPPPPLQPPSQPQQKMRSTTDCSGRLGASNGTGSGDGSGGGSGLATPAPPQPRDPCCCQPAETTTALPPPPPPPLLLTAARPACGGSGPAGATAAGTAGGGMQPHADACTSAASVSTTPSNRVAKCARGGGTALGASATSTSAGDGTQVDADTSGGGRAVPPHSAPLSVLGAAVLAASGANSALIVAGNAAATAAAAIDGPTRPFPVSACNRGLGRLGTPSNLRGGGGFPVSDSGSGSDDGMYIPCPSGGGGGGRQSPYIFPTSAQTKSSGSQTGEGMPGSAGVGAGAATGAVSAAAKNVSAGGVAAAAAVAPSSSPPRPPPPPPQGGAASAGPIPSLSGAQAAKAWRELQEILHRLNARPGDFFARIVMEAADRGSLLTAIRQGLFSGGAPAARLNALLLTARDVARGMSHLHRHAVIHGDLKPSNVLLRSDPADPRGVVALVSDFGLSRIAPHGSLEGSEPFGTVGFMAPEVFAGSRFPSSDVYAYGVLLWQMINKLPPWPGLRNVQVMMGVLQGELRLSPPAGTHPPLAALLERCLAPNHSARPSFEVIERELEEMLSEVERGLNLASAAAAGTSAAATAAAAAASGPAAPPGPSSPTSSSSSALPSSPSSITRSASRMLLQQIPRVQPPQQQQQQALLLPQRAASRSSSSCSSNRPLPALAVRPRVASVVRMTDPELMPAVADDGRMAVARINGSAATGDGGGARRGFGAAQAAPPACQQQQRPLLEQALSIGAMAALCYDLPEDEHPATAPQRFGASGQGLVFPAYAQAAVVPSTVAGAATAPQQRTTLARSATAASSSSGASIIGSRHHHHSNRELSPPAQQQQQQQQHHHHRHRHQLPMLLLQPPPLAAPKAAASTVAAPVHSSSTLPRTATSGPAGAAVEAGADTFARCPHHHNTHHDNAQGTTTTYLAGLEEGAGGLIGGGSSIADIRACDNSTTPHHPTEASDTKDRATSSTFGNHLPFASSVRVGSVAVAGGIRAAVGRRQQGPAADSDDAADEAATGNDLAHEEAAAVGAAAAMTTQGGPERLLLSSQLPSSTAAAESQLSSTTTTTTILRRQSSWCTCTPTTTHPHTAVMSTMTTTATPPLLLGSPSSLATLLTTNKWGATPHAPQACPAADPALPQTANVVSGNGCLTRSLSLQAGCGGGGGGTPASSFAAEDGGGGIDDGDGGGGSGGTVWGVNFAAAMKDGGDSGEVVCWGRVSADAAAAGAACTSSPLLVTSGGKGRQQAQRSSR